jgi:hypothetical protein
MGSNVPNLLSFTLVSIPVSSYALCTAISSFLYIGIYVTVDEKWSFFPVLARWHWKCADQLDAQNAESIKCRPAENALLRLPLACARWKQLIPYHYARTFIASAGARRLDLIWANWDNYVKYVAQFAITAYKLKLARSYLYFVFVWSIDIIG